MLSQTQQSLQALAEESMTDISLEEVAPHTPIMLRPPRQFPPTPPPAGKRPLAAIVSDLASRGSARPTSNNTLDSAASSEEMGLDDEGPPLRLSSMTLHETDVSVGNSAHYKLLPLLPPQPMAQKPMAAPKSTANLPRPPLAVLTLPPKLSPHQRFRLNRINLLKNKRSNRHKDKEKEFDAGDDEIPADLIVWNVPMAVGPASSFYSSPSASHSKGFLGGMASRTSLLSESSVNIQPTPLPGKLDQFLVVRERRELAADSVDLVGTPVAELRPDLFTLLLPIAQSLSSFYMLAASKFSEQEVQQRTESNLKLPLDVINADRLRLEDLRLISQEKLHAVGAAEHHSARDMWLPPKLPLEMARHDREAAALVADQSRRELELRALAAKRLLDNEANRQRWFKLSLAHRYTRAQRLEIKLLVWQTPVPDVLKYNVWKSNLCYHQEKRGATDLDEYLLLRAKMDAADLAVRQSEVDAAAARLLKMPVFAGVADVGAWRTCFNQLAHLLLFSTLGRSHSDEVLVGLVLMFFPDRLVEEVYVLVHLIKVHVLNEGFAAKLHRGFTSSHRVKALLTSAGTVEPDYHHLDNRTPWLLWLAVDLPEVVKNFFEVLVVGNDYKLVLCYVLTVLTHYHFGWNLLVELGERVPRGDAKVHIYDHAVFMERLKNLCREV